ncbi:hypothetical protein DL93DRAFT_1763151 [Clavulina sp. PMI_390]|nr:hypothetical protein DL93DRAFT_1763151 [Clavulina sp. PMI_390]
MNITRSNQAPLSLYLYGTAANGDVSHTIIEEVSTIIAPHLSRCRHIQFESNSVQVYRLFCHPLQLPNLQSLVVTVHQSQYLPIYTLDLTFATQLRHLIMSTIHYTRLFALALRLGSDLLLTRLDLQGYFEYRSVVAILENCPHLEYLRWEELGIPEIKLEPSLPLMESLHEVVLRGIRPLYVLSSLNAPQLSRLQFNYFKRIEAINYTLPHPLSDPSQFPMLRTLVLQGRCDTVRPEDETIARFVEAHPHLESLAVPVQLTERMKRAIGSVLSLQTVSALPSPREFEDHLARWSKGTTNAQSLMHAE